MGCKLRDDARRSHLLTFAVRMPSPRSRPAVYPGNQDPHKSLQPIRSSNSRSRLPRDQRSTTESTEMHGKENPNRLPLSAKRPYPLPIKTNSSISAKTRSLGWGIRRHQRTSGLFLSYMQV